MMIIGLFIFRKSLKCVGVDALDTIAIIQHDQAATEICK
jgi:hypothetical protein